MKITGLRGFRRIKAVFCMIILFYFGAATIKAEGLVKLKVSSDNVRRGDVVEVTFSLSGNPGISGMQFEVGYDHDVMTLNIVEVGSVFAKDDVTLPAKLNGEKFVFSAISNKAADISADGTLVKLVFSIGSTATLGEYPITAKIVQATNVNGDSVDISVTEGKITIMECLHENTEWRVIRGATCEVDGQKVKLCKDCGEMISAATIAAIGHIVGTPENAVEATMQEEGYTGDVYCEECNKLLWLGAVIPKIYCPHLSAEWKVTEQSTCEKNGIETKICKVCGMVITTRALSATGHINTVLKNVAKATENKEGYTGDKYCNDCGKLISKGSVIPKLVKKCNHEEKIRRVVNAVTCEVSGLEEEFCAKCGIILSSITITAKGHGATEIIGAVKATEDKEGYTGDECCRDCGKVINAGSIIAKIEVPTTTSTEAVTTTTTTVATTTTEVVSESEVSTDTKVDSVKNISNSEKLLLLILVLENLIFAGIIVCYMLVKYHYKERNNKE